MVQRPALLGTSSAQTLLQLHSPSLRYQASPLSLYLSRSQARFAVKFRNLEGETMDSNATEEQSDPFLSKEALPGSKSIHRMGTPQHGIKKRKSIVYWGADLKRREKDREDVLARVVIPGVVRNVPPFLPRAPFDIAYAIAVFAPERFAFASWLALVLCLVINVVALTVYRIRGGDLTLFLMAVYYSAMGIFVSLCRAMLLIVFGRRRERPFVFGWFLLTYMLHIGTCLAAAISPPISFYGNSFYLRESLVAVDVFVAFVLLKCAFRNVGGSTKRIILWEFLVRLTTFLTLCWWGNSFVAASSFMNTLFANTAYV